MTRRSVAGASNSVRGVFGGGDNPHFNTIDYITLASEGDAKDFGTLSSNRASATGVSNHRRAVFCGGSPSYPAGLTDIEFVEIASTGNAQDFGDLSEARWGMSGVSDAHGGLGGY